MFGGFDWMSNKSLLLPTFCAFKTLLTLLTNCAMDQWTNGPMVQWTNRPINQWTRNSCEAMNSKTHWKIGTLEHLNIWAFDIQLAPISILWHQLHWYCLSNFEWHLWHQLHQWTGVKIWKSGCRCCGYIEDHHHYKSSSRS